MIRSMMSQVLLGLGLLHGSFALAGCSGGSAHQEEAAVTGTFSMPLLATAGVHRYRLQGGLYVSGPTFQFLDIDADTTVLSARLRTGDYFANLYSWSLTRDNGAGNFVPVSARLVSSSSPSFSIFNQTTTTVSFQFETDGQIVTVGAGSLNIDVGVHESPSVCTLLGSDCASGTWCAPTELTGMALRCIVEGPVPVGETCRSPLDCAANSSCFDFGAGASCQQLCSSAEFTQACGSGGICTQQGSDYGVCVPDSPVPEGGGSAGQ